MGQLQNRAYFLHLDHTPWVVQAQAQGHILVHGLTSVRESVMEASCLNHTGVATSYLSHVLHALLEKLADNVADYCRYQVSVDAALTTATCCTHEVCAAKTRVWMMPAAWNGMPALGLAP
eukprot:1151260-Pelagomonas_calceolata.AAC.2